MVSGVGVKRNREMIDGRWDKHDTKDAAVIADLIAQGKCFYYELPSREISVLRGLLSLRRRLKKEEHSLRMRIRNHVVAVYFPEIDHLVGPCGADILNIIYRCVDPRKIADMSFSDFYRLVGTQNGRSAQQKRLLKIYRLAPKSIGCPINDAVVYESQLLVRKLVELRKDIKAVDEETKQLCQSFEAYKCLMSIPGFGPFVSSQTLAVLGDPFRFNNQQQVLKLAGFDLSASRSGKKSDQAVPVLSKRGNSALRYALYQAALSASTRDVLFVKYFTKLLTGREKERGIKTKMRVKLAAKMLVIAWTLMKNNEPFNPECLNLT
jgi:transposase